MIVLYFDLTFFGNINQKYILTFISILFIYQIYLTLDKFRKESATK